MTLLIRTHRCRLLEGNCYSLCSTREANHIGVQPVSYTHLDVYKRQVLELRLLYLCFKSRAKHGENLVIKKTTNNRKFIDFMST